MHGVRRGVRPSAAELLAELERSSVHADLIRRALIVRRSPIPKEIDDAFRARYQIVDRALETNPDEYTLWAFRREVFIASADRETPEGVGELWKFELQLTTRALQRHPKAYPAWQHRLWLLEDPHATSRVSPDLRMKAIAEEQKLSAVMLAKDGRNFHGWAHRMRVRAVLLSVRPGEQSSLEQKELAFVENKINEDFANYSAWHHRSVLLPKVHSQGPEAFVTNELQYVRQAFYTEPEVQSAWFYHRWLLAGAPAKGKKACLLHSVLEDELAACDELLALEPDARYAMQTKAQILVQLERRAEAEETIGALEKLDPMRRGYYRYLRRKAEGQLTN